MTNLHDARVAAFKAEWAKADAEGDAGNRVSRGLAAADAVVTAEPSVDAVCHCARCCPKFYGFRVCSKCGNKRCPKNEWHGYKCTGSNEPGQVAETDDSA